MQALKLLESRDGEREGLLGAEDSIEGKGIVAAGLFLAWWIIAGNHYAGNLGRAAQCVSEPHAGARNLPVSGLALELLIDFVKHAKT